MYTSSPGGNYASHKPEIMVTERESGSDIEAAVLENESLGRPLVFLSAVFVGLAVALIFVLLLGFGMSQVFHSLNFIFIMLMYVVDLPVARRWTMASPRTSKFVMRRGCGLVVNMLTTKQMATTPFFGLFGLVFHPSIYIRKMTNDF